MLHVLFRSDLKPLDFAAGTFNHKASLDAVLPVAFSLGRSRVSPIIVMASTDIFQKEVGVSIDVAANHLPTKLLAGMFNKFASTFRLFSEKETLNNAEDTAETNMEDEKPFEVLDCYINNSFANEGIIQAYFDLHTNIRAVIKQSKGTHTPVMLVELSKHTQPEFNSMPALHAMWRALCVSCSSTPPGSLLLLLEEVAQLPYPSMAQLVKFAAFHLGRELGKSTDQGYECTNFNLTKTLDEFSIIVPKPTVDLLAPSGTIGIMLTVTMRYSVQFVS